MKKIHTKINGCRAIDTVQCVFHLCYNKHHVWIVHCPWKQLKLTTIDKCAKIMVNAQATMVCKMYFVLTGKIVTVSIFRISNYTFAWTVKQRVLSRCSVSFIASSNVAWKFVPAILFASDISSVDGIDIHYLLTETVRPFILQSNDISQINTS